MTDDKVSPHSTSGLIAAEVLAGERVAFTGTMASMTHRQAAELAVQHGGTAHQHVTQQTTLLVIGDEGWPLEDDGHPSVKLLQAQALQTRGFPIKILSETDWLNALGLEPRSRARTLYTPAMLSQLLGVSVHEIRRWERLQLIQPVRRVMRLPYFDFDEVTNARRLADLIQTGVPASELAASFEHLRSVLPSVDRPLAQLEILARGHRVLYRDAAGWIEPDSGQRVFAFEGEEAVAPRSESDESTIVLPFRAANGQTSSLSGMEQYTARDWFEQGCRAADANDLESAIEAYRLALIESPEEAEFHFHLADALYRSDRKQAAIERYYCAVERDHDFIEAWTQLGCVLSETGDLTAARQAFEVALDRHPDYPDAHFQLARTLKRLGDPVAACDHWRAYLQFDALGPWADEARQQLEDAAPLAGFLED